MNVFEKIREDVNNMADRITGSIKSQYSSRLEVKKKNEEYIKELTLDVLEAKTFLASSSFPRANRYYDETIKNLYKELKNIWLTSDLDSVKQIKKSIQISAKIDQLENLRARPQKLIDEIKKYKMEGK